MRYFIKLNIVSALYGLIFAIPFELFLDTYRILRITNIDGNQLDSIMFGIVLFTLIGGGILSYHLQKNWFGIGKRKSNFWSILFWFPYSILFLIIIAYFTPPMAPGDELNAAAGLIIIASLIMYPFYILFMNSIVFIASELLEKK